MTDVELRKQVAKTSAAVERLAQEVGGLSNKFGDFTEGPARRSLDKVLRQRFGAEVVIYEAKVSKGADNDEYDMLGVANGTRNEVVVVEITSHLDRRKLEKVKAKLHNFLKFMPAYSGAKIRGLIAAVYLPRDMQERVHKEGLYLATGADENFSLIHLPTGFKPADFAATAH